MAKMALSGWTAEEVADAEREYVGNKPFMQTRCLARIPHQPDGYDGPQRYCANTFLMNGYRCRSHGGAAGSKGGQNPENLDKLANMKHGMRAAREHVVEKFNERDRALYEWIQETFPEAYGLDLENDPLVDMKLHQYAVEVVRAERGEDYILDEGEKQSEDKISEDGTLVIDPETGKIKQEHSQHYLADMIRGQHKLLMKFEKELGLSRKERLKQDTVSEKNEVMAGLADSLGDLIGSPEEHSYDPEDFNNGDS